MDLIKFYGGYILNFFNKKVDVIIIDKMLLRKIVYLKLFKSKFIRF